MDLQRILATLDQPADQLGLLPALGGIKPQLTCHYFEELASTNTQAWALIDGGAGAGTVVLAKQQTAGRGQWSREWTSLPGGLYLSLVLEPEMRIIDGLWLTLASAWGIVAALNTLGIPVQIKWPNDLVLAGQKLGGILAETRTRANSLSIAVIGVGINWSNPVPSSGIALAPWLQSSPAHNPASNRLEILEDLIAIALRGILQGVYTWQQQGNAALCDTYQDYLINVGQMITLDGHPAQVIGVSEQGTLKVAVQTPERKLIRELRPGEIQLGYGR